MSRKMAAEPRPDPSAQKDLLAVAYVAATRAEAAGEELKRLLREAQHVLQLVENRFIFLSSKVETKKFSWHLSRVDGYRQACTNIRNAMRVLETLMNRAERAGLEVSTAATNMTREANVFDRLILVEKDVSGAVETVKAAKELTDNITKQAREAMYLILKAMEECLLFADFEVTDSWMDTAGDFITPVTVGGCVFFSCMYRHLDKIKDPIYFSFLGIRIPVKLIIPGSIITCGILSAVHFIFGSSARVSSLEDDTRERQERNEMLVKVKRVINDYRRWFLFARFPLPSFEEAKNEILGTET